jgi:hypothetical protein
VRRVGWGDEHVSSVPRLLGALGTAPRRSVENEKWAATFPSGRGRTVSSSRNSSSVAAAAIVIIVAPIRNKIGDRIGKRNGGDAGKEERVHLDRTEPRTSSFATRSRVSVTPSSSTISFQSMTTNPILSQKFLSYRPHPFIAFSPAFAVAPGLQLRATTDQLRWLPPLQLFVAHSPITTSIAQYRATLDASAIRELFRLRVPPI